MREIKFRAKTLTGELIYFSLHDGRLSGDPDIVFYVGGIPCEAGSEQQYTGLKDKNCKEIYEGDILRIFQEPPESNKVEFVGGSYQLAPHGLYLSDWHELGEVIGNIFENPELLN